MSRGESVVLDASWTGAHHRRLGTDLAEETYAELVEIECRLDPSGAKERIARRREEATTNSDATAETVDHLGALRDPWVSATGVDTGGTKATVLDHACGVVLSDERP